MNGHRTIPTALRVQKYLGGLRYPASKSDVLARARQRGAEVDEQVMLALLGLPERAYDSPITLSCEVGRQAEAAARSRKAA
ncbi:MAG TPA: DUF2795 domain-containing protein [Burkholderiales bacterium]|nr:DUF2795 domain-containing protein [Burkholderiales bacterium]